LFLEVYSDGEGERKTNKLMMRVDGKVNMLKQEEEYHKWWIIYL
jgi:hypothetical protein